VIDVHRAGAEVLGVPWEKCDVVWGDTSKHIPFTCVSGGSQTTHAMTRAAHAVAMDARKKLQEIAAKSLGGQPEDYEVANERVFGKRRGAGMTFAQAAQRAIQLGGIYDGHVAPADVNSFTKASVAALAGQGLVAAARDNYPRDGMTHSYVASFAEVEVDVETGKYYIVDFLAYADVGTVIHPHALGGQVLGRSTLGIGHAIGQKWVFDPHYGEMVAKRFHHNRPPLDRRQRPDSVHHLPHRSCLLLAGLLGDLAGQSGPGGCIEKSAQVYGPAGAGTAEVREVPLREQTLPRRDHRDGFGRHRNRRVHAVPSTYGLVSSQSLSIQRYDLGPDVCASWTGRRRTDRAGHGARLLRYST